MAKQRGPHKPANGGPEDGGTGGGTGDREVLSNLLGDALNLSGPTFSRPQNTKSKTVHNTPSKKNLSPLEAVRAGAIEIAQNHLRAEGTLMLPEALSGVDPTTRDAPDFILPMPTPMVDYCQQHLSQRPFPFRDTGGFMVVGNRTHPEHPMIELVTPLSIDNLDDPVISNSHYGVMVSPDLLSEQCRSVQGDIHAIVLILRDVPGLFDLFMADYARKKIAVDNPNTQFLVGFNGRPCEETGAVLVDFLDFHPAAGDYPAQFAHAAFSTLSDHQKNLTDQVNQGLREVVSKRSKSPSEKVALMVEGHQEAFLYLMNQMFRQGNRETLTQEQHAFVSTLRGICLQSPPEGMKAGEFAQRIIELIPFVTGNHLMQTALKVLLEDQGYCRIRTATPNLNFPPAAPKKYGSSKDLSSTLPATTSELAATLVTIGKEKHAKESPFSAGSDIHLGILQVDEGAGEGAVVTTDQFFPVKNFLTTDLHQLAKESPTDSSLYLATLGDTPSYRAILSLVTKYEDSSPSDVPYALLAVQTHGGNHLSVQAFGFNSTADMGSIRSNCFAASTLTQGIPNAAYVEACAKFQGDNQYPTGEEAKAFFLGLADGYQTEYQRLTRDEKGSKQLQDIVKQVVEKSYASATEPEQFSVASHMLPIYLAVRPHLTSALFDTYFIKSRLLVRAKMNGNKSNNRPLQLSVEGPEGSLSDTLAILSGDSKRSPADSPKALLELSTQLHPLGQYSHLFRPVAERIAAQPDSDLESIIAQSTLERIIGDRGELLELLKTRKLPQPENDLAILLLTCPELDASQFSGETVEIPTTNSPEEVYRSLEQLFRSNGEAPFFQALRSLQLQIRTRADALNIDVDDLLSDQANLIGRADRIAEIILEASREEQVKIDEEIATARSQAELNTGEITRLLKEENRWKKKHNRGKHGSVLIEEKRAELRTAATLRQAHLDWIATPLALCKESSPLPLIREIIEIENEAARRDEALSSIVERIPGIDSIEDAYGMFMTADPQLEDLLELDLFAIDSLLEEFGTNETSGMLLDVFLRLRALDSDITPQDIGNTLRTIREQMDSAFTFFGVAIYEPDPNAPPVHFNTVDDGTLELIPHPENGITRADLEAFRERFSYRELSEAEQQTVSRLCELLPQTAERDARTVAQTATDLGIPEELLVDFCSAATGEKHGNAQALWLKVGYSAPETSPIALAQSNEIPGVRLDLRNEIRSERGTSPFSHHHLSLFLYQDRDASWSDIVESEAPQVSSADPVAAEDQPTDEALTQTLASLVQTTHVLRRNPLLASYVLAELEPQVGTWLSRRWNLESDELPQFYATRELLRTVSEEIPGVLTEDRERAAQLLERGFTRARPNPLGQQEELVTFLEPIVSSFLYTARDLNWEEVVQAESERSGDPSDDSPTTLNRDLELIRNNPALTRHYLRSLGDGLPDSAEERTRALVTLEGAQLGQLYHHDDEAALRETTERLRTAELSDAHLSTLRATMYDLLDIPWNSICSNELRESQSGDLNEADFVDRSVRTLVQNPHIVHRFSTGDGTARYGTVQRFVGLHTEELSSEAGATEPPLPYSRTLLARSCNISGSGWPRFRSSEAVSALQSPFKIRPALPPHEQLLGQATETVGQDLQLLGGEPELASHYLDWAETEVRTITGEAQFPRESIPTVAALYSTLHQISHHLEAQAPLPERAAALVTQLDSHATNLEQRDVAGWTEVRNAFIALGDLHLQASWEGTVQNREEALIASLSEHTPITEVRDQITRLTTDHASVQNNRWSGTALIHSYTQQVEALDEDSNPAAVARLRVALNNFPLNSRGTIQNSDTIIQELNQQLDQAVQALPSDAHRADYELLVEYMTYYT